MPVSIENLKSIVTYQLFFLNRLQAFRFFWISSLILVIFSLIFLQFDKDAGRWEIWVLEEPFNKFLVHTLQSILVPVYAFLLFHLMIRHIDFFSSDDAIHMMLAASVDRYKQFLSQIFFFSLWSVTMGLICSLIYLKVEFRILPWLVISLFLTLLFLMFYSQFRFLITAGISANAAILFYLFLFVVFPLFISEMSGVVIRYFDRYWIWKAYELVTLFFSLHFNIPDAIRLYLTNSILDLKPLLQFILYITGINLFSMLLFVYKKS